MGKVNSRIEPPSTAWALALLAAIVTVLWQSKQFSLWHTIIGTTLLLMLMASSKNSEVAKQFISVQSALLSLCVLLIIGPFLRFVLSWSGLMEKGLAIVEASGERQVEWLGEPGGGQILYEFPCYHIFALGIWILVWIGFFIYLRSKVSRKLTANRTEVSEFQN